MRTVAAFGGVLAVLLLALTVRALGFEWVFVDGDTVVFAPGDAQYHVRRTFYAFSNFPSVLFVDPYLNFPGGAAVSWPPLFDFVVGRVTRMLTSDPATFEVIAAWAPPVFGTLALLPVFATARRLGGIRLGLGAAALLALFPLSVTYSRIGQLDHHCAVALCGAFLLWVVVRLVDGDGSRSVGLGLALAIGRAAILLTWHGSLLYLALVEAVLWVAAAVMGRRDLYGVQAWSAAATAAVVAPVVWWSPEPLGGAYSAIALSRLHVLAMVGVVLVSLGSGLLQGRQRLRTPVHRLATTFAIGLVVAAGLLLLPGPREGLEPALRFLTLSDGVGQRTGEQLPLFTIFGRVAGKPVTELWGLFGFAIPLLPFAVVWATPPEKRAIGWVVAAWCGWFVPLAVLQRRYGNDLGPAAAVGFALVLAAFASRLVSIYGGRPWIMRSLQVGLAIVALGSPLVNQTAPKFANSLAVFSGARFERDPALLTVAGTLTRFMQQIRAVTPETSGYFDTAQQPEYGVVAHANFGHAIQNVARRPTPSDPFWNGRFGAPPSDAGPGFENSQAAFRLLAAPNEAVAFELAAPLKARYVMTFSSAHPETVEGWLHQADGRGAGPWAASEHFRLITEGPPGGVHYAQVFQLPGARLTGHGDTPYKLFEIVEGAVLEVAAAPGEEVSATLQLAIPRGRKFGFEWRAVADAGGRARLRVPYPTGPAPPLVFRSAGLYRVRVGGDVHAATVSEEAVRTGATIEVVRQ